MSECKLHEWDTFETDYKGDPVVIDPTPCPYCRIAALENERELIANHLLNDPPFHIYGDTDLHEEASINASALGRDEANAHDYYAAFLTCITEVMKDE